MMYSEFIETVGCPDRDTNIKVFQRLDKIYMSDDTFTKEDFIEWGKKLADFSEAPAITAYKERCKKSLAEDLENLKEEQETLKELKEYLKRDNLTDIEIRWTKDRINATKKAIKDFKELIKYFKGEIKR